jgi:hypothetical protein
MRMKVTLTALEPLPPERAVFNLLAGLREQG